MLINGKFVLPDEKKSIDIQAEINKNTYFKQDSKSDFEDIKKVQSDNVGAFPAESFNVFKKDSNLNSKESYYGIYP
jgi:hypothetical protein